MSAGSDAATAVESFHGTKPTGTMSFLAPAFARAVEAAITECNNDTNKLAAMVYETYRSNELQALYYQRGRSVIPPSEPVTNAQSNLYSWHGYGLAVDVIHRTKEWDAGDAWFEHVATIFKKHGCKWGGDWRQRDLPHFQWGLCRASPSDRARELLRSGGVLAVWDAVGALTTGDQLTRTAMNSSG